MEDKITKKVELLMPLYDVINGSEFMTISMMIRSTPNKVIDALSYNQVNHTLVSAKNALKTLDTARKSITSRIDESKKMIMDIEKDAAEPLNKFIEIGRNLLLEYNNELERKQKEANEKLKKESEEALSNSNIDVFKTLAGYFADQKVTIETEQPKNIRTIKKAELISDVMDVDWQRVVECLIKAGNFNHDLLLKDLYKSMNALSIDDIKGIEIVLHKIQSIK